MNPGMIFWAPLKHPRHEHVNLRLYMVVAKGGSTHADGSDDHKLAIVGLETNGGRGGDIYFDWPSGWLRNISKDTADDLSLLVEEGLWKPKPNTVVDLSTLLVVEGHPTILCQTLANLSATGMERLDEEIERLRCLEPDRYVQLMTGRTRKRNTPRRREKKC
jgi:hypothetical protein